LDELGREVTIDDSYEEGRLIIPKPFCLKFVSRCKKFEDVIMQKREGVKIRITLSSKKSFDRDICSSCVVRDAAAGYRKRHWKLPRRLASDEEVFYDSKRRPTKATNLLAHVRSFKD
jgi:hypothetical protein